MLPEFTRRVVAVIGLIAAFATGCVADHLWESSRRALNHTAVRGDTAVHPVEVTLHRFKIRDGQSQRFADWIAFLHKEHGPAVESLERERTYFEAMFTDREYPDDLLWVVAKDEAGAPVETSKLPIDVQHKAYMQEVLVPGSHRRLKTENVLMPDFVTQAIAAHRATESTPPSQRASH